MNTKELHENFILLHNFEHDEPLKKWVEQDETYTGQYHTSWDALMPVVQKLQTVTEEPEELDDLKYNLWFNTFDSVYAEVVYCIKQHNANNS